MSTRIVLLVICLFLTSPGATVVGACCSSNSGYGIMGQMPGNVLLAFSAE